MSAVIRAFIPPAPQRRITVMRVAATINLVKYVGILAGVLHYPGL